MIYLLIFIAYGVNVMFCALYHSHHVTRRPNSLWDFIKLTFAPYLIYKKIRKQEF